jgi:hypothetical protein
MLNVDRSVISVHADYLKHISGFPVQIPLSGYRGDAIIHVASLIADARIILCPGTQP